VTTFVTGNVDDARSLEAALEGVTRAYLVEDYAHYAHGEAAVVDSSVRDVTGVEPRDIKAFARDYARAFIPQ
jgi:regulator of RNase E activity RraA